MIYVSLYKFHPLTSWEQEICSAIVGCWESMSLYVTSQGKAISVDDWSLPGLEKKSNSPSKMTSLARTKTGHHHHNNNNNHNQTNKQPTNQTNKQPTNQTNKQTKMLEMHFCGMSDCNILKLSFLAVACASPKKVMEPVEPVPDSSRNERSGNLFSPEKGSEPEAWLKYLQQPQKNRSHYLD